MPPATSRLSQKEREDNILVNAIAKGVAKAVTDFVQDSPLTVARAIANTQNRADLAVLMKQAECNEQSGALTAMDNGGRFVAHMVRDASGEWHLRARN